MKKYWYVVILAVSLLLLGACVTDTTSDTTPVAYPSLVSDLEEISENESVYVVTVLTDEEVVGLITDVIYYLASQEYEPEPDPTSFLKSAPELMSELIDDATGIEGAKGYYDGLIGIFNDHPDAVTKLEKMVSSSKVLVGETDLEVEITGKAKEDIIEALNALIEPVRDIEAPETLILDYRDVMYLRALAGGLLSIYDSEEPVNGWFTNLDQIIALMNYIETGESLEQNPINDDALNLIAEFVSYLNTYDGGYPFENQTTWTKLDTLIQNLAGIAAPTVELNTADIFAEGILQIGGMDFLVETLDYFIEIMNGIYVFEVENTDAFGWINDGKTSLYEYAMTLSDASSTDDISIKSGLGEDISVEGMPEEITELKFGSVDLLQEYKAADLLGELNGLLPTKELAITTKASTSTEQESMDFSGSLSVDFGALSGGTLELLNNNLGVEAYIIDELIAIEIWDIIKADTEPTQEQIEQIIGIILNNLTFIEKGDYSLSTRIDIGHSISEEVTIETEGITIDELIREFITASMQPL